MFEYKQAFRMLCLSEGWEWTLHKFLRSFLNQAIGEYLSLSDSKSAISSGKFKNKKLLGFYLLLQCDLISLMCPKEESPVQLADAIKSCELLLKNNSTNSEQFLMECIHIDCLLSVCAFEPNKCLSMIRDFLTAHQKKASKSAEFLDNKIPSKLERKIDSSFNHFKLPK